MPPEAKPDPNEKTDMVERIALRIQKDKELFASHPWWAVQQGYVLTLDEKPPPGVPPVRPFPDKEYLRICAQLWLDNPKGLLCKSRQILMSWLFAWLLLWDSIVFKGRHNLFQGKRQDDVAATSTKGILGRARFIRDNLPFHLKPTTSKQESTIVEAYDNGSVLEAIPEGKDIIRSKSPSKLLMDELAFHETGEDSWNTALPAAGSVWGVTTPNGRDFCYKQADKERDRLWDNWRDWPMLAEGIHGYRNRNGVMLVAVHYTADEDRRTQEYQDKIRGGYTNMRRYMQEQELSFVALEGQGVWSNEFNRSRHVIDSYEADPTLPIHRGWDPGYNGQAVCMAQLTHEGQLVLFDQVIYKAVALPKVVQEVEVRTRRAIGNSYLAMHGNEVQQVSPSILDYGDPAARQHNAKGETDIDTLSKYNIRLLTRTTKGRKQDLVEQVRALLLPRSDGKPGLVIARNSPEMEHVIAMFEGGYHYEKPRPGKAEKEIPAKDGFFDHIADSIQYLVDNVRPTRPGYLSEGVGEDWWRIDDPGIGMEEPDIKWRMG